MPDDPILLQILDRIGDVQERVSADIRGVEGRLISQIDRIAGRFEQHCRESEERFSSISKAHERMNTEMGVAKWAGGLIGSAVVLALLGAILSGLLK